MKKILYAVRWQLSGLILIPIVATLGPIGGVILGNLIGAVLFWNVDKYLTKPLS